MDENSSDYTNNDPPESTPDQIQPEDTSYTTPDPQSEGAPTENTSEEVEFIPGTVSWTAAEYAESEKSRNWFVILILGAVILAGLALFLLSDWILALMILVMAIALVVIVKRPPQEISYTLSNDTFFVGQKSFPISSFRAFGLVQEGAVWNVRLISNRRFMPPVTAYIPNDVGEKIVDTLGALLPMEDIEPDFLDKLVTRSKI